METSMYLSNLRDSILLKMEEGGFTLTEMSIKCDVSARRLSDIVRGEAKDISFSTFINICENSGISYAEIFEIDSFSIFENMLRRFILTDGKYKYKFRK